jgi:prepilin-type processing-associated H-X9-DG protein
MESMRIVRFSFGVGVICLLAGIALRASEPEDELRAATVLTFIRHAEWLQTAPVGPIIIGIVGRPAMIQTLRRTLDGKTANNHAIRVLATTTAPDLQSCHVLYLAMDNNKEVRQTLAGVHSAHALTIGETDRFLEYGGAVNLMFVDGHMSFEVSLEALERAGVSISSNLLRYGQLRGRPPA